jgi:hypothetical protein
MVTRTLIAEACLCLAVLLPLGAQTPDYFPLQIGNSWMYRGKSAVASGFRTISVDAVESIQGRDYFKVSFFGRTVYLRRNADGALVSLNSGSGMEEPWLSLNLPEGSSFPTRLDTCTSSGTIQSRSAEISLPVGQFTDAVEVAYQAGVCADAGITEQVFAPQVGLVRHEETSISGPRPYELVYFRAGSLSATGPEVSFTVALDAARYKAGGELGARLTLRSTLPEPIRLQFPSGQSYDLRIFNEKGDVVYTWSDGRAFTLIFRDERFGPGERTYGVTATLPSLPPGSYKAQAYLATSPRMYLGEAAFEIVP